MKNLTDILRDHKHGGVFRVAALAPLRELALEAKRLRYTLFHVSAAKLKSKDQFLSHTALALRFPEHFGQNWDAFEDCLTDLAWIEEDEKGYVLVFDHLEEFSQAAGKQLEMAAEILIDVAEFWEEQGMLFLALFVGPGGERLPIGEA